MKVGRCNAEGCKAPILWVRTINGGRAPLDAEPVDEVKPNDVVLVKRTEGEDPLALSITHIDPERKGVLDKMATVDVAFYRDHHATCANVDDFRNTPL